MQPFVQQQSREMDKASTSGSSRLAAYCGGQSVLCSMNCVWTASAYVNSKDLWVQLKENFSSIFLLIFSPCKCWYLDFLLKNKCNYILHSSWEYGHSMLHIHINSLLHTKCFHIYYFLCSPNNLDEVSKMRYPQPYFPDEKTKIQKAYVMSPKLYSW